MKTPTKVTLISIAVVAVLVVAGFIFTSSSSPDVSNDPVAAAAIPDDGGLPGVAANSHVLDEAGPEAPTLVEYLDFECEACGAFYPYIEEIRAEYQGEINYVVRYFPLPGHLNSMNAAVAVEAAAQQDRFEDMYGKLFETQADWGEQQTSQAPLFRTYAEELGLDMAAFDTAVADPATEARVTEDLDQGRALGIQGTPTFFLDGQQLELTALTDLTDALDRAIAQ
ncbi:DsbA family protein [Pseudoclavibacter helvolus]|uniref:Protein-disulfide isomerase n=1 Tax=Pseudoclavibacter helvolus TaxID=255205 RepID=A0A7W4YI30_9MICO|nr:MULTISPECIES: thioredoxin domain-containing protein [Pseudoclavibacter]MBB2959615.1 protein-disulfide isomerase [Pseudoclavibacter helvolus]